MASSRKPKGGDRPGNRNRKNPTDDYFEANESDEGVLKVMIANGKTLSLPVKGLDTIRSIKLQIKAVEGISFREQELIFNETLLQDTDILGNLCIKKNSTFKLMRHSKGLMNIFVERPGPYLVTMSLEVKPSDTIRNLKAKMIGHNIGDALIFNEIVLDDDDTLADLNIIDGSTLTCIDKSQPTMEIFVNTFTGKTISLFAKPTDTISDVKLKIYYEEQIPVDEQVLIFNKVVLGDSGTILDFQINRKSTLTLLHRSRGLMEPMQIFIKTLTGETITQIVKPSDTMGNIKIKIQDQVHIPPDEQELIFNKKVLHDMDTLASYNINNESTLTVMRISQGFMRLFIKFLTGNTITLEFKPFDTIQNVKSVIHNMLRVPNCQQRLIHAGKQMEDRRTLADYDVHHESTIHVLLRLPHMKECSILL